MKYKLWSFIIIMFFIGCSENIKSKTADTDVPLAIPCVACNEKVSKQTEECRQCGHPTSESVVAYLEQREISITRAKEQKAYEESLFLAEVKSKAKLFGLDNHEIILNATEYLKSGYTGWLKKLNSSNEVQELIHYKDGMMDGLNFKMFDSPYSFCSFMKTTFKNGIKEGAYCEYYKNGNPYLECNYKNDKIEGIEIVWNEDGSKKLERTYRNGKQVGSDRKF